VLLRDELDSARKASGSDVSSFPLRDGHANLNLTESIFEIVDCSPGRIHADQALKQLREAGISFIAGGHYNTEKLGVLALGEVISDRFDVEVESIDLPNEV
jgi:hypothetical protein